ncbi:MAG: efflux RND transporter periplasmic adaptor subunit [Acidobacteriia bacterium]|nr:efflux RND transporter periplasmic adaptor subunit [Terriglobia bacterium]
MKHLKNKWTVIAALVIAVGVFAAFDFGRTPSPQYFTASVERGDIHDVVEATGTINAVTTVQVGSQVSGTIAKLAADFNSHVKNNQVIAEIDPSLFRGALLQAQADLQDARANLAAAKANLVKAQATAEQTAADYQRNAALAKEGVVAQQQLDLAKANADTAQAAVSAAQAQVTQAGAQVAQKAAAVSVAQTNLDHTIIRSPIDGTVVARNIDVGQTVAASLQAPTLFNIAQDLTKMQVYAATDESDVGQIKVGQPITFKVDAFPRDTFHGVVSQIRMNATTVQNVVTYNTIIDFDNPDTKLFPGMTAYVTIPVASATNVVKVPNGALRFQPGLNADQMAALEQQAGITPKASARQGKGQGAGKAASASGPSQPRPAAPDTAIVWKLTADKQLTPVQIATGITDHTFTEVVQVLHGSISQGEQLVVGSATTSKPSSASSGSAPGMGSAPRVGGR